MGEIRRRLRELPRERRRDLVAAIRGGRTVRDPRDAALAVAWAETLDAKRQAWAWPWWVLPRSRPRGWRAWIWLLHLVWITAAIAVADATLWHSVSGLWRWIVVGLLAYGLVTMPFTIWRLLQAYWNASDSARENHELLRRAA
jgi:hypothetical protein